MTNDELDYYKEFGEPSEWVTWRSSEMILSEQISNLNNNKSQKFKSKKGLLKTKDWLDTMNFIKKIP